MLEKIKNYLYRVYKRSYGMDDLNKFLLISAFVLSLLRLIMFGGLFYILSNILFILFLFRFLSSKKFKRGEENRAFRKYYRFVKVSLELRKTHKVMLCECGQMIRVPKGKGKIEVTCPCCGKKFDTRS